MHLPLGNHGRETQQQQDAREARKLFKDTTRTDWNYPPLPAYQAVMSGAAPKSVSDTIAGLRIHGGVAKSLIDQIVPEVAEWHEREYGSSDSDIDESDNDGSLANERTKAAKKTAATFLFDNPHTVKEELADRARIRKARRQCMLAEEIEWNDGLQHFIARRDLWTGAKTRSEINLIQATHASTSNASSNASTSSPRSSTSLATDATDTSRPSTAMTTPEPSAIPTLQPLPAELLTPRMTRVLTAHPIRKKIGPGMYSEIYLKIISQSRTPSVPINLLNLTRALVSGWKADGEWPPKPGVAEPSVGRRRGLREGVKAAARVLKITSSEVTDTKDEKKKAG